MRGQDSSVCISSIILTYPPHVDEQIEKLLVAIEWTLFQHNLVRLVARATARHARRDRRTATACSGGCRLTWRRGLLLAVPRRRSVRVRLLLIRRCGGRRLRFLSHVCRNRRLHGARSALSQCSRPSWDRRPRHERFRRALFRCRMPCRSRLQRPNILLTRSGARRMYGFSAVLIRCFSRARETGRAVRRWRRDHGGRRRSRRVAFGAGFCVVVFVRVEIHRVGDRTARICR